MKYLYVGGLGREADREAIARIRERAAAEFPVPVREIELPGVEFAYDPGRGQYRSIEVLEMLAGSCPADAYKLLGVTERDLFIPVLTFVYGQAQLDGRVAVVSMARLRQEFYGLPENREVFLERVLKEAMHETGHAREASLAKHRQATLEGHLGASATRGRPYVAEDARARRARRWARPAVGVDVKITPYRDTPGKQAVVAFVNSGASRFALIFPLRFACTFFQFC